MARAAFVNTVEQMITVSDASVASPLSGVRITVYKIGSNGTRAAGTPTLYSTRTGTGTVTNPFNTNTFGQVEFWVDAGQYEIEVVDTASPKRITDRTGTSSIGFQAIPAVDGGIPLSMLAPDTSLPDDPIPPTLFTYVSGDIKMTAVTAAPTGWLLCDGAAVSRTTYSKLFAAISTTYGTGNGSSTFNVPDLRSRTPMGAGQGSGLTSRAAGAVGGAESVTLTTAQMPSHSHSDNTSAFGNVYYELDTTSGGPREMPGSANGRSSFVRLAIGNTGGGGSHGNVQPFQVVTFMIKT